MRGEDGTTLDATDIRNPVVLEMEFEVIKAGFSFLPHFHLFNETGVNIMTLIDLDREWQNKSRPPGTYRTTVTIPGNFFSECTVFVHANMISLDPVIPHFIAQDVVAFQVVDNLSGGSARGVYAGNLNSIVRPAFEWQTEYTSTTS